MARYSIIIVLLVSLIQRDIVMNTEVNVLFIGDIILAADIWFQSVINLSYHCIV